MIDTLPKNWCVQETYASAEILVFANFLNPFFNKYMMCFSDYERVSSADHV